MIITNNSIPGITTFNIRPIKIVELAQGYGMGGKYLILFFLSFFAATNLPAQTVGDFNEHLQKGHQAANTGNVEEALALWRSMYDSTAHLLTDPRIGLSYIELVTRQKLKNYYPDASKLYYWGLSNPVHPILTEELAWEVERLEPIAEREDYKFWKELLEENRLQALGESILGFWKTLDPTLNSSYNERLLEHWERIAYAKENFKRARTTIYETDDRALIYIKYGEPDHIRDGILGYNTGQMQMWVQDALQVDMAPGGSFNPVDSASRAAAEMQMQINLAQKMTPVYNYEREIRLLHRYPYYEIWVYEDILDRWENLIFIFGSNGDTGEFGLRRSLEDMMPSSAFRTSSVRGVNVPPAYFLQLLFYENMLTVDSYFADAFRELENRLYSLDRPDRWTAFQMKSRNYNRLFQRQLQAPGEYSSYEAEMPDIAMDVFQYRLLNNNNEPYLATFVYSRPHQAFYLDQIKKRTFTDSAYILTTSVMTATRENKELYRSTNFDEIPRGTGDVREMEPVVSFFEVPNPIEKIDQVFTVELHNRQIDSNQLTDRPFTEDIGGLGSKKILQKEPLSEEKEILEMGDLMVGYKDVRGGKKYAFGFKVRPDGIIPEGKNLMVHFEIYHLKVDSPDPASFQVEYAVNVDRSFFGRLFGDKEKIRLSLNFESASPDYRDNLEIDTSPFEPGKYILTLTVKDPASTREVKREINFEIKEEDKE